MEFDQFSSIHQIGNIGMNIQILSLVYVRNVLLMDIGLLIPVNTIFKYIQNLNICV